jgi:hypothetical protein
VVCTILVLSAVACSVPAGAQRPGAVAGSLVRFAKDSAGTSQIDGKVLRITRDSIAIEREIWIPGQRITQTDSVTLPLSGIHRLETRTGIHRHVWAGLGIGALSGGVLGGLAVAGVGKAVGDDCQGGNLVACGALAGGRGAMVYGALGGAVLGGLLGTVIGSAIATEDWVSADIRSTARLEIIPRTNGLGVRLSYVSLARPKAPDGHQPVRQ